MTSEAREALGSKLVEFEGALQDRTIMRSITVVNEPLDVIEMEGLLLPEEYFSVYNMNATERERLAALKQILRSTEIPDVAKDSIILILAVFNMRCFGVSSHNPERFIERA